MKQTVHILRKDLRALWIQIVTVLSLHVLYCLFRMREGIERPDGGSPSEGDLVAVLLVLGWFSLIAAAVHEEALPGVRQFWLTRPYSLWSLIGAKLLLCILIICIPLFISDLVLLNAASLPVISALPALLARQLPNAMMFLAPAFVLATITSSAAGFWTSFFATLVLAFSTIVAEQRITNGSSNAVAINVSINWWPWVAVIMASSAAFIVWQYRTRSTKEGRVVMFAAILTFAALLFGNPLQRESSPIFFPTAPGEYSHFNLTLDLHRAARSGVPPMPDSSVRIDLPVRVEGVEDQDELQEWGERLFWRRPERESPWSEARWRGPRRVIGRSFGWSGVCPSVWAALPSMSV